MVPSSKKRNKPVGASNTPLSGRIRSIKKPFRKGSTFDSGRLVADLQRKRWEFVTSEHATLMSLFDVMLRESTWDVDMTAFRRKCDGYHTLEDIVGSMAHLAPYCGDILPRDPSSTDEKKKKKKKKSLDANFRTGWISDIVLVEFICQNEYRDGSVQKNGSRQSGCALARNAIHATMDSLRLAVESSDSLEVHCFPSSPSEWGGLNGVLHVRSLKGHSIRLVPTWEPISLQETLEHASKTKRGLMGENGHPSVVELISAPLLVQKRLKEIAEKQPLLWPAFQALHRAVSLRWSPTSTGGSVAWRFALDAFMAQSASDFCGFKGSLDPLISSQDGLGKESSSDALTLFLLTVHNLGKIYDGNANRLLGKPTEQRQSEFKRQAIEDATQSNTRWGVDRFVELWFRFNLSDDSEDLSKFAVDMLYPIRLHHYGLLFEFNSLSRHLDRGMQSGKAGVLEALHTTFSSPTPEPAVWDGATSISGCSEEEIRSALTVLLKMPSLENFNLDLSPSGDSILKLHLAKTGVLFFALPDLQHLHLGPMVNTQSGDIFQSDWSCVDLIDADEEERCIQIQTHDGFRWAVRLFDHPVINDSRRSYVAVFLRALEMQLQGVRAKSLQDKGKKQKPTPIHVVPLWGTTQYIDEGLLKAQHVPGNDPTLPPWREHHYWISQQSASVGFEVEKAFCLVHRWLLKVGLVQSAYCSEAKTWKSGVNLWWKSLTAAAAMNAGGFHWSHDAQRRTLKTAESIFYAFVDLLASFPFGQSEYSEVFILPMGYSADDLTEDEMNRRMIEAKKRHSIMKGGDRIAVVSLVNKESSFIPLPSADRMMKLIDAASQVKATILLESYNHAITGVNGSASSLLLEHPYEAGPLLKRVYLASKLQTSLNTSHLMRVRNVLSLKGDTPETTTCRLDYLLPGNLPVKTVAIDDETNHMIIGAYHSLLGRLSNVISVNGRNASSPLVGSAHVVEPLGQSGLVWTNRKPSLRMGMEPRWLDAIKWSDKMSSDDVERLISLKFDVVSHLVENMTDAGEFAHGLECLW